MQPSNRAASADATWGAVEEELGKCGLGAAAQAARSARERGYSPQGVLALVDHWRDAPGKWGEGALYHRLCNVEPDAPPNEGWPPPSAAYQSAQRKSAEDRRRSDQQAKQGRDRAASEAEQRERQELEARFGGELDRLPQGEREALEQRALAALGTDEGTLPFFRRHAPNVLRFQALRLLARERGRSVAASNDANHVVPFCPKQERARYATA